jgi:hypothetical protein
MVDHGIVREDVIHEVPERPRVGVLEGGVAGQLLTVDRLVGHYLAAVGQGCGRVR